MRWRKRVLRSGPVQALAAVLIAGYARLVWASARVEVVGESPAKNFWDQGKPVIVALWHGRLFLMPFLFPSYVRGGVGVSALISAHRDGRLITRSASYWGITSVSGSSTRGGAAALREMLHRGKKGETLFITPDGPRGPRMHLGEGTAAMARLSGLPLVPVAISSSRGKCARSWDRFLIPGLFSKIVIVWGTPAYLAFKADEGDQQAFRHKVEEQLRVVQNEADRRAGREVIQPGDLNEIKKKAAEKAAEVA